MIRIRLKGGLGNQLFQYAYGRALELSGKNVVFDISFFEKKHTTDTVRSFQLEHFNIQRTHPYIVASGSVRDSITFVKRKLGLPIEEYYQSEKYFATIEVDIRKEFTLKVPLSESAKTVEQIILRGGDTVALHVRRGDYVSNRKTQMYHGTCSPRYYGDAIAYMTRNLKLPRYFIFSDDIAWAKEHLGIDGAIFVSDLGLPDYEELILMSKCQHNIIANSSFSWWGAWLNQNSDKIVIAPKQWVLGKRNDTAFKDIVPPDWIRL